MIELELIYAGIAGGGIALGVSGITSLLSSNESGSQDDEEDNKFGGHGNSWTSEDIKWLVEHEDTSNKALAKVLGRTEDSVQWKKSNLGLTEHKGNGKDNLSGAKVEEYKPPKGVTMYKVINYVDPNKRPPNSVSQKLNWKDAVKIYLGNQDQKSLSSLFDVSEGMIEKIKDKTYWSWVTDQVDEYLTKDKEESDKKGRQGRKLSREDVVEIYKRIKKGESNREIAKDYPVTRGNIRHIRLKHTWRDVTNELDDVLQYANMR